MSRSIKEIALEETDRKPHTRTYDNTREDYRAATEGVDRRPRPIEKAEHRADGLPDTNDPPADGTVDTADRVESVHQSYRGTIGNLRQHTEPIEKTQHEGSCLSDGSDCRDSSQVGDVEAVEVSPGRPWWEFNPEEPIESDPIRIWTQIAGTRRGDDGLPDGDVAPAGEQDKGEEPVEAPPARVAREIFSSEVENRLDSGPVRKRARIPWLRALMLVLYLGIIAALAVSESAAYVILRDARAKELTQEHDAAFDMYRSVVDGFPFSFVTIEARQSLRDMCQSPEYEMPEASWLPVVENLLGSGTNMPDVHVLPLVAWPISAVLLVLVFVTRIRRPGLAFLALLLVAVAIIGSVAQLAWYGSISFPQVANAVRRLMQAMPAVYLTSYLLLVLTALMTLTATTKHTRQPIAKPDEFWDVVDGGRQ